MSKYTQLNPYSNVHAGLESFLDTNIVALLTMMLRQYQGRDDQRLREMNVSKPILDSEDRYIGLINIHLLNKKFDQINLVTTRNNRFPDDNGGSVISPAFFSERFVDESEIIQVRLSFKQFRADNLGLSDLNYSTIYTINTSEPNHWVNAKGTREVISRHWDDPAIVIAIREFYKLVEVELGAWTPAETDITTQTLIIL